VNALSIRDASVQDLDTIEQLEHAIFSHPWSRGMLASELSGEQRRIALIAFEGDEPRGFAFCWRVEDELHLVNLGVVDAVRGQGVAQAILDHILAHPRAQGARIVTLEVRMGNQAAKRFYLRNGFLEIALRPEYYPDTGEDAVIMLKTLDLPEGEDSE